MPSLRSRMMSGVVLALAAAAAQAYPLTIDNQADTSFDRRFDWTIGKSLMPATIDLNPGDQQTLEYAVSLIKSAPINENFVVSGSATISNGGDAVASISSIQGSLGGNPMPLDCGGFTAPDTLAAGASITCTYAAAVMSGASLLSVVTVTTSGGDVEGGSDSAMATFDTPTSVTHDSVTVSDTLAGMSWIFSDTGSQSYTYETGCVDGHNVILENTATIDELEVSASLLTRIRCHVLRARKTAETSFNRLYRWDIEKTHAESAPLLLIEGQTYGVPYTITATATASASELSVSGIVSVENTNRVRAATLLSITDNLAGVGPITLDCPSMVIPPGGILECGYTAALPDDQSRLNTAIATQQNFHYAVDGTPTPIGTTDYLGSAMVVATGAPESETDACIDLFDEYLGDTHALGQVCADESPAVRMFVGPITIEADTDCEFEVENLARFVTNDSGTTGSDSITVAVERSDCDEAEGCVLTPGYWKTHSSNGPAPYDDNWESVGEDTPFFLAVDKEGDPLSWYEVLWQKPKGNAYFTLARAFIAATLNGNNGADASQQVLDALAEAETLFETYTIAQIGALRGNQAPRPRILELAGILDMYNNGTGGLGPDSCSEDDTSIE
jgi:hypothetical protein